MPLQHGNRIAHLRAQGVYIRGLNIKGRLINQRLVWIGEIAITTAGSTFLTGCPEIAAIVPSIFLVSTANGFPAGSINCGLASD